MLLSVTKKHKPSFPIWFQAILMIISLAGLFSGILLSVDDSPGPVNNFLRSSTITLIFVIDTFIFFLLTPLTDYMYKKKLHINLILFVFLFLSWVAMIIFFSWENFSRDLYREYVFVFITILIEFIIITFLMLHVLIKRIFNVSKKNKSGNFINNLIATSIFLSSGALAVASALLTIGFGTSDPDNMTHIYEKFIEASTLISDLTIIIFFFMNNIIVPIIQSDMTAFLSHGERTRNSF